MGPRGRGKRRPFGVALGLLFLLLTSWSSGSAGARPPSSDLPGSVRARLQAVVNEFRRNTQTPGVLAGVWTPGGAWVSATGVSDLTTRAPMAVDMQYKIGSLTKTFTATVILQLVGEGKVSLNDHVAKWIPGVPNGNRITIRQLLHHTSGLSDLTYDTDEVDDPASPAHARFQAGCTPDVVVRSGLPPIASPGSKWSYSNYGYELLGRVAELATGKSLTALIRERITAPLGLRRTFLPRSGFGLTPPLVHGYVPQPSGSPSDFTSLTLSCAWAAGGMVSTLADMHRWSVALATGRLLRPRVWSEARRDQVYAAALVPALSRSRLTDGLGFFDIGGFLGHQGNIQGYDSATYYSPALHTTIAVADNGVLARPNIYPGTTALAQELAVAAAGRPLFGLAPGRAIAPFSQQEIQEIKLKSANA